MTFLDSNPVGLGLNAALVHHKLSNYLSQADPPTSVLHSRSHSLPLWEKHTTKRILSCIALGYLLNSRLDESSGGKRKKKETLCLRVKLQGTIKKSPGL